MQPSSEKSLIKIACPACRTVYKIAPDLLGKKLVCAKCRAEWDAIAAETLKAAAEEVSDLDAELMDLGLHGEKTAPLVAGKAVEHDYWIGKSIGRYRIASILGTGALGHVYRGHDPQLSRDVAIKILAKPKGGKMTMREKLFLQEARAAARLQHPNIVTVHEVGLDGQFYYYAMEVVDGGTLKELVLAMGRLSPARACFLIGQAAQALAYSHSKGVIHRDVKPDNLMMDRRGVLKVADFGLAEIGEVDVMQLYQNRPIGTPGYIAPETARGQGASAASDIYCAGLCLYFVLTGLKYFKAPTIKEQVELCANPPQFEPGPALSGIPNPCVEVLRKCLQHEPSARYGNAQDLADDLRRFVVDMSRDDSRSQLPLPGEDPFTGELSASSGSRLARLFGRASRFFSRKSTSREAGK